MAEAEFQGSEGHGIMRLNHYVRRIQAGGVNPRPDIRVVEERAAMARRNGGLAPARPPYATRPPGGPGGLVGPSDADRG